MVLFVHKGVIVVCLLVREGSASLSRYLALLCRRPIGWSISHSTRGRAPSPLYLPAMLEQGEGQLLSAAKEGTEKKNCTMR